MAVVTPTVIYAPNGNRNGVLVTWSPLANGDTGGPVEGVDFADCTVQIGGTFGVGGSVTLQGSNDGTQWDALTDPQGNAVTKTAVGIEVIEENPRYKRPSVTAGDGTTALTVSVWARRER
jgi:hypothetical protein